MKTWFTPDGFVGDDETSRRNACWLAVIIAVPLVFALGIARAGVSLNPDGHAGERARQESRIEELAQKIDALDARVKALEAKR